MNLIYFKYNEQIKKIFRFSYVDENSYVSEKNKKRITIPADFYEGQFYLRNIDTNEEYLLTEKVVKFDDVKRFFKTSIQYEWTDNPHLKTTDVAILCSELYRSKDFSPVATLSLNEGVDTKKYHWIPFKNEITIINSITGEEQKYLGKTGRLIINLYHNNRGGLEKVIPNMTVLCRKENLFEPVKIFRKNQEGYSKDRFVFEEYDQHRGILISKQLDKEHDVKITIIQNDKEYNYPIGLNSLDYGLFMVKCEKQNHICTYKAFCLNDSDDIYRNFDDSTFNFSRKLFNALGGIVSCNLKIETQATGVFKENLFVDCGSDRIFFSSNDDKVRIPVYRVSKKAFVIFVKGNPELVEYKKNALKPTLYVSKQKQEDITGINVIDENGVYGILKENVIFVNYQLQTVLPNNSRKYNFCIPQDAQGEYLFAKYNFLEASIISIYSGFKKGDHCSISSNKNEIIVQLTNAEKEPDYRFLFISTECLHVNSENLSLWLINSCRYGFNFNSLYNDLGTNCFEWILERNKDSKQEIKRLTSFLNCLLEKTDYMLSDKECKNLNILANELGFSWLFLYPKIWSMIINGDRKEIEKLNMHVSRNSEITNNIKEKLSKLEQKIVCLNF